MPESRVLIIEDNDALRVILFTVLRHQPLGVDTAATAEEAMEKVRACDYALILLDMDLPGLDGLTAAEQLHQRLPECRTLVLTGLSQPGNLLRALKAHVRGFILKDAPAETLADSVRRVARNERVIDPELVAAALETGSTPLTDREADVLRAAQSGISTEDIGARLSLSPATVRNYLSNAISKVGARNRIDAIRIARDAGWL